MYGYFTHTERGVEMNERNGAHSSGALCGVYLEFRVRETLSRETEKTILLSIQYSPLTRPCRKDDQGDGLEVGSRLGSGAGGGLSRRGYITLCLF